MSPLQRPDFRFLDRLRVRWAEVDMQRIVFNGHYLMYFDTAVAGYWRALAMPYHDTMQSLHGDLFVRKATLEYEASARYDDLLDVGIHCARIGSSSIVFDAAVFRGAQRLVLGELLYVFANPATQTSQSVPQILRDVLLGYEAGEAMVSVRSADWTALAADARPIREAVFVQEQGIPAALEHDAADATAVHAVAYNRFGRALGTGRLLQRDAGVGQIGRMAVLATVRGAQVGRALLDALANAARARGDRELMLHTQASAIAFYARAGFVPRGAPFEEAGIAHQEMVRAP